MKACFPILLCALLWVCFFSFSAAQNPVQIAPADATSARQLLAEAVMLNDSGQFVKAKALAEHTYNFFHQYPKMASTDLAEAAYQTGRALYAQKNYARADSFFTESLVAWEKAVPEGSAQESRTRLALGNTFIRLQDMESAMEQGQKTLGLLQRLGVENTLEHFGALRLVGRVLYGTGQYNKAIPYYEEALQRAHIYYGEETVEMAQMMIYYGNCLNYCGLIERAIATLERGLAIQQRKLPPTHDDIAGTYMALGSCNQALKKYDHAMEYYEKAIEIRSKSDQGKNPRLPYAYSKIGQICLENRDFDKALKYFQKSDEIFLHYDSKNEPAYAYTCRDFGLAYHGLQRYDEAIKWFNKAWTIFQGPDTLGSMGMGLDQCYLAFHIGRAQSAGGHYELALQSFAANQKILEKLFGSDYPLLFELNAEIGITYTRLYLQTGQDSFLERSRTSFRLAEIGLEQQMQNETLQSLEKTLLFEALPYYEHAIGTEFLFLKSNPNDEAALEKAWQLSEAMHGQLLLAAVKEASARHFAGIPDAELRRDSLLQSQIAMIEIERKSLSEAGRPLTDSLVLEMSRKIFAKKEEARALRAAFEKDYPDYYNLKYDTRTSSLKKTQEQLSLQQTLLEYFIGDSSIFVFVVQREGSRVVELPRDFALNDWVQALREGISGYYAASSDKKNSDLYKKTLLQYADAAQKLYAKLIAPLADYLTPEIIVVPGDGIANLPFEALLSATPKDLSNFSTYPFFLRKHSVQYAYSATMLHQMTARTHLRPSTGELLAFAPFFEEDTLSLVLRLQREGAIRLGFSALPFSGEEVFKAKNRYIKRSKVLTGKMATKQKFLDLAAQHNILHLATHGKANHRAGDFSFLAFASGDDNPENGLLSVGELYNLPLNADLVILSACETGIGEQQRGEGVVSLARAFAYAGAKSIVASLWSVNDKSTMLVMDNFYSELKSGKTKHVALSKAKLRYLEQNPGQAHPFFWAGFVGVGDLSAIK
ncbi:MAG: CHAT domain-containing protein [Saprospiraceae bacterium]